MRMPIIVLTLMLLSTSSFAQGSSEPLGGKTSESVATPAKKKPVSKPVTTSEKPLYSPCGVYYRNRAEMSGGSRLGDKWFSLGESANKHFWHNPRRTTCDAKTSVLKSWIKEDHKNTDGDFALVLYELKCKTNQLRVKTVIEYDKTGSVLETNNHGEDSWQDAAPRTAGEVMVRTVCRRP
jgi:Surface-adhesin protein E